MDQVDWRGMIFDLQRAKFTVTRIAKGIRVARTTVLRWRDSGGVPLHSHGERLIAFWAKELGKDISAVPRSVVKSYN